MQIRLRFQIFQCFMIRMYDKFLWPQMMLPNLKNTNKCIQFFIINRVVQSSTRKLLTAISYRSTFLHQDTTNAYTTSITFNFKVLSKFLQCKYRCRSKQTFQLIKCKVLSNAPNKRYTFLSQFIQRSSNSTKVFHKTSIKTSKTVKTSYLTSIHGSRPILNCFHFRRINLYPMLRYNKTQKYDLIFCKCALLKISI